MFIIFFTQPYLKVCDEPDLLRDRISSKVKLGWVAILIVLMELTSLSCFYEKAPHCSRRYSGAPLSLVSEIHLEGTKSDNQKNKWS